MNPNRRERVVYAAALIGSVSHVLVVLWAPPRLVYDPTGAAVTTLTFARAVAPHEIGLYGHMVYVWGAAAVAGLVAAYWPRGETSPQAVAPSTAGLRLAWLLTALTFAALVSVVAFWP